MVKFGQIVVGPPGAGISFNVLKFIELNQYLGKTSYCLGMQMFTSTLGRNCDIINLDFANDNLSYTATVDVRNLITLEVRKMIY